MNKRLRCLSLIIVLAFSLCCPIAAAENSSQNFIRQKTYAGQFTDVAPDSSFYDNAAALYEYGLSVGKSDGTFGLQDNMTIGQIVIFAGRIRSLYATGDTELGAAAFRHEGQAAYEPYLAYLQSVGVLATEFDGLYTTLALRCQVAHVLAATLPQAALPLTNDSIVTQCYASRRYIKDVNEYTPYYQDILALYKAGISVGSDASGTFSPNSTITRGAASAMLTRLVDANLRLTPSWSITAVSTTNSATGVTWGSLITADKSFTENPMTQAEISQNVAYMLSTESSEMKLNYRRVVTTEFVTQVMNMALDEAKSYCEQMYNSVKCTYTIATGEVTLAFSALTAGPLLPSYRDYTLQTAIAVHDQLWNDGIITTTMTEKEKAKIYYKWICDNSTYDNSAGNESLAHIAYSLFRSGTAVCDGYTGAYNLFLKLEGIDCYALPNEDHIWTVATLDGVEYHIDTTWGDNRTASTPGGVDYTHFAMTPEQSWAYHPW